MARGGSQVPGGPPSDKARVRSFALGVPQWESAVGEIGHASEVTATNFGFGMREVFMKVRPEMPKPGRCMNFWVDRK